VSPYPTNTLQTQFNPYQDKFTFLTGDEDNKAGIAYFNRGVGRSYQDTEFDFFYNSNEYDAYGNSISNPWNKGAEYGQAGIPSPAKWLDVLLTP
jgi:hypothetical protein